MKKTIEYEIVKLEKTENENEIDKLIKEFKENCKLYKRVLGQENSTSANDKIQQFNATLVSDIIEMNELIIRTIKFDINSLKN